MCVCVRESVRVSARAGDSPGRGPGPGPSPRAGDGDGDRDRDRRGLRGRGALRRSVDTPRGGGIEQEGR